jgi:hypothetical protein
MALGAALLLAGCGPASTDSTSAPSTPNNTVTSADAVTATTAATTSVPAPATTVASESTTEAPGTDTDRPAGSWNPCDAPDSALASAGLNVASEQPISNPGFPTEKSCKWKTADDPLEFYVTAYGMPVGELRQTGKSQQFRAAQDTHKLGCYIAVPASFGGDILLLASRIRNPQGGTDGFNSCDDAQRIANSLVNHIP